MVLPRPETLQHYVSGVGTEEIYIQIIAQI